MSCGLNFAKSANILRSAIVDYVKSNSHMHGIDGIAYIYFSYKQQGSQTIRSIYASIVAQLLYQIPDLQVPVKKLHEKHDNGKGTPGEEELVNILSSLLGSYKIILAFDALDEASNRTRANLMLQLAKLEETSLLVFFTSRPDVEIKSISKKARMVNVMAHNSDLETFIRANLEENPDVQDILDEDSQAIIPQIVDNVIERAAGM